MAYSSLLKKIFIIVIFISTLFCQTNIYPINNINNYEITYFENRSFNLRVIKLILCFSFPKNLLLVQFLDFMIIPSILIQIHLYFFQLRTRMLF